MEETTIITEETAAEKKGPGKFGFRYNANAYSDELTKKVKKEFDSENINKEDSKEEKKEEKSEKKEEKSSKVESGAYSEFADFLMDGFDGAISTLSMFIAKDSSSKRYQADKEKKIKLTNQLSRILEKHNFGIGIEFLFVIGLIMAYAGKVKESISVRSENEKKEKERRERLERQNSVLKKEDIIEYEETEEVIVKEDPVKVSNVGRKSKAEEEMERKARLDRILNDNEDFVINI